MEQKIKKYQPLLFLLTFPILGEMYNFLNHSDEVVYSMVTNLDRAIPFVKQFIIPYWLWSPFILVMLLFFFKKDLRTYYNVLIALNFALAFNLLVFSVFQTTVPRPGVTGADIWSVAVRLLYKYDAPYNCFPSGHVVTSWIVLMASYKFMGKSLKFLGAAVAVTLIIASTLLLKQHTLMDAVASVFIGSVILRVVTVFDLGRFWAWTGRLLLPRKGTSQEG